MRKLHLLLLSGVMILSLTGCGYINNDANAADNTEITAASGESATTPYVSIKAKDADGNDVSYNGTVVTDSEGNATIIATDDNGNTVEIKGKASVDSNGNSTIEEPTVAVGDNDSWNASSFVIVMPENNNPANTSNNNSSNNNSVSNSNSGNNTSNTESSNSENTYNNQTESDSGNSGSGSGSSTIISKNDYYVVSTTEDDSIFDPERHVHEWNPIYEYVKTDVYGDVPQYATVKRMKGYPFKILNCDELGINESANQLYLDWHVGENGVIRDSIEQKYINGTISLEDALEFLNNPDNFPYPETYNYSDPRANITSYEQIGTTYGVVSWKYTQVIDHYECSYYGSLCDGKLTVDEYNAMMNQ